jgi:hypothetical protein
MCTEDLLQVYKDRTFGGQWYWCPKCRFAGDSIELAARVWRIGIEAAVLKLMTVGVRFPADVDDSAIADYARGHVGTRARIEALWQAASTGTDMLPDVLGVFARGLGIPATRPPDWSRRGGQFIGVLDWLPVIRCFQPAQIVDDRVRQSGGDRIFKGKGWGPLLVIPYRDLPGRICGLLMIGREARYPEDFIYKSSFAIRRCEADQEYGVSMLEAILRPHPTLGNTVFACTDAALAIRLQLAHFIEHGYPLPLVGTWGDATSRVWEMLPARPTIVFGPEEKPREVARLLRLAQRAGRVSRIVQTAGQRPSDVLKLAEKNALDWPVCLEDHLQARPAHEAEELFLALNMTQADATRFLRDCHPQARAKLSGLVNVENLVRTVEYGRRQVVEEGGLWKDARSGELFSDVVIVVERVIHQRRSRRIVLEGVIRRKGVEAPFVIDQLMYENHHHVRDILRTICLDAGLGMPVIAVNWARRLLDIAQLFRPATFLEVEGVLGWDDASNAFVFPKFALAIGGSVQPGAASGTADQPGLRFEPPDGLTPGQIEALSSGDISTRLFWATAAAVLAAAVAPCLGLAPPSTALTGFGAVHTLGPLASSLGCPVIEARHGDRTGAVTRIAVAQRDCTWPIAATTTDRSADRFAANLPSGSVCRVGTWTADVLALLGGWTVVDATDRGVTALSALRHGPAMVVNYLRHFCVDRPPLTGNLVNALLADLTAWFVGLGGRAQAVWQAAALLRVDDPDRFADRFAELVARAVYEGDLESIRADLGDKSRLPALASLGDGLIHIPRQGIARALTRRETPPLDGTTVTRRLDAAGVLVDERDHDGQPGWVIPEPWWTERSDRWKEHNRTYIKGNNR